MSEVLNHKAKTIQSLKWSGLNQALKQGLNLGIGILLARLLNPDDFGLLGMVTVLTGFMQLFNDFGFGSALIQKQEIKDEDIASVFWFNLATGIVFCLILMAISGWVASFYGKPELKSIVIAVAWIFVLQALAYVQITLFRKSLDFKSLFLAETLAMLVSGSIALWMAVHQYGVWSLIAQLLTNALVLLVLVWLLSSWRPSFVFSKPAIQELLKFSLPLMGSNAIGYLLGNLDKLLIGRFLGSSSLGIYSRAYSLMVFPVGQVSGVVSQVMFPSLAQIQDDIPRVRQIYLRMNQVISAITLPIMGAAFLFAEPFVLLVLGPQWEPMIPVFQCLTLVGALQSISTLVGNIFMALGKMKFFLKINAYSGIVFLVGSILGLQFGLMGVSISFTLATLLVAIPQWILTIRLIDLGFFDYLKSWVPIASIVLGNVLVFFLIKNWVGFSNSWLVFGTGGLIFCLSYAISLLLFKPKLLTDLFYREET
ncbi:lipopolysaccharide biosynthesis protein [Bacteroidota bacterium]